SYLFYLVSYFFLGLFGFYILVKIVIKDELLAAVAYVLLLFSGVGTTLFNQINILLIFVPAVWFFCFLLKFFQTYQKKYFIGMTGSVMLVMTSYIPLYFLTLFLGFSFFYYVIYRPALKISCKKFLDFSRRNIVTVILCLFAIITSCLPIFLFKQSSANGAVVAPARHHAYSSAEKCVQKTLSGGMALSYQEIWGSGLSWRFSFREVFSHLDKWSYSWHGIFYVPLFAFLLIFLSCFTGIHKKGVLLCVLGLFIFLVSLGAVGNLHPFLYKFVFYFKYFRNLFFFIAFLMPIIVLIAVVQLQKILNYKIFSTRKKNSLLILSFILHLLFFVFLLKLGNISQSSYLTLAVNLLFFTLYFSGYFKKRSILFVGLIVLSLMQPIEILSLFQKNAGAYSCSLPAKRSTPRFEWTRLQSRKFPNCLLFKDVPTYVHLWNDMTMNDSDGGVGLPVIASRWTFALCRKIHPRVYARYVRNKFVVYDDVEYIEEGEEAWPWIEDVLGDGLNMAFISEPFEDIPGLNPKKTDHDPFAQVIDEKNKGITIEAFDVNALTISTNFSKRKFLVYNDSYHPDWDVVVNGRRDKPLRANVAFKGVWVPAGRSNVRFEYRPWGGQTIYAFVLFFYWIFFFYAVYNLAVRR
ncbi:YfhO family protein, partial [bacterium]|nr:YfhO family protein [bacterium]